MRLGVLSDTHDELDRTRRAIQLLQAEGAEALAHCGDLTNREIVLTCAVLPCYFVFGNHDADNVRILEAAAAESGAVCLGWGGAVTLAGKRVAIAHGHLHIDVRPLLTAGPDYLLSGHLHFPLDWREGPTRRICPGALHRADTYTVALIDFAADEVRFLTIPN